eukprot:12365924-Heterocapsa_arctica.AAC.1
MELDVLPCIVGGAMHEPLRSVVVAGHDPVDVVRNVLGVAVESTDRASVRANLQAALAEEHRGKHVRLILALAEVEIHHLVQREPTLTIHADAVVARSVAGEGDEEMAELLVRFIHRSDDYEYP